MKKIAIVSLASLFVLSCSVPVANNSTQDTSSTSLNFAELEKEYKSFSTKALSDGYVSRMFNKFLIVTPNPTQVIRQLEFARYLKDVKSDTTYFNSLKNIITNDSSIYTKITTTSGVPEKKSAEPASFGVFVDSLSPAPGVPVANSATEITANSFTANWNSVSGATSYIIVINGVETPLGNVTTYTKSGLTEGTAYSYSVKAVNTGGTSSNSNTINVLTIPSNPTANTASSITSASFTANWSSVTGATGYKLTVDGTETDVGLVTSKNVTELTAGSTHTYYVKAYNASGTGSSSSTITTVTVPAAPVANTASAIASTSFTANWETVSGATGYKLFVNTTEVYSGTDTNFNVTGLIAGSGNNYYVKAINNSGESQNSNTVNLVLELPATPTGLSVDNITPSGFTAHWNAVSGATSYEIVVDSNSPIDAGNNTMFAITGLTGTSHTIKVRSKINTVPGNYSSVLNVTLVAPIVSSGLLLNLDAGNTGSYTGSGTAWTDLSGNANNATLVNGPAFSSANGGNIIFDGTNDFVKIDTTPASLRGYPSFTVCGWFKKTGDWSDGATWGIGGDLSQQGINSWNETRTNEISIDLWGTSTFTTGQVYSATEWKFISWVKVAGTFSKTNITIYVNNTPYTGTNLLTIRDAAGTPNINNNGIVLGKAGLMTDMYYSRAGIGSFMIYNRALSQAEILQNYNATKSRFGL